jgi:hypothetical protein
MRKKVVLGISIGAILLLVVAVMAGCAYTEDGQEQAGMGLGVADYDCDGWLDVFKTNFADDTCNLYHNNGDGTFTDVTFVSGIGVNTQFVNWGAGFVDYDNDGWADIFHTTGHVYPEIENYNLDATLKTPRIVYHNLGNGKFKDVSKDMGPGVNQRYSSRGIAFGDYDNDGDVDVLILNMNDPPSLLRNDGGNQNNWIKIKLLGTKCNRTAIGARVRVVTGKHAQIDEVHSGTSVMSQSDLRLHFGLGQAKVVDLIEVKWPTTQKVERFTNVEANQFLTIKEGSGIIKQLDPASLRGDNASNKDNWIKIKLVATQGGPPTSYARVRVLTGQHTQIDEVHTGNSVMSQSDLRLHFGLGQAKVIDLIEVKWPTMMLDKNDKGVAPLPQIEKFTNIEANQILTIKEGEGIIKAEKTRA